MALEHYKKLKRDEEEARAQAERVQNGDPEPEKPSDMLLADILKDKVLADRYAEFVMEEMPDDGADLLQKLAKTELVSGDLQTLVELGEAFSKKLETEKKEQAERKERVKEFEKGLTKELFEKVVEGSPELKVICKSIGKDKVRAELLKTLEKVAAHDEAHFNSLMESLAEAGQRLIADEALDSNIEEACKRLNVSSEKVIEALRIGKDNGNKADIQAREQEIEKLVKNGRGLLKKWFSRPSQEEYNAMVDDLDFREKIDEELAKTEDALSALGGLLAATVDSQDAVRLAVNRKLIGDTTVERPERERKANIFSFADARQLLIAAEPSQKEIREEWDTYVQSIAGWDKLDEEGQREHRMDFLADHVTQFGSLGKKANKEQGHWKDLVWNVLLPAA